MKKMKSIYSKCSLVGAVVAGLASCQMANAALTVTAQVGGNAFSGVTYEAFDGLTPGATGVIPSNAGLTVTLTPNAQVASGNNSGVYAAPFLTPNNNQNFGAEYSGPDQTTYLSAGSDSANTLPSAVTLSFQSPQNYLGLLWGSVDAYNTLTFLDNGAVVGSVTGTDVIADADGSQAADGTTYVNITGLTFDEVIATSSQYAFEFDNVAYGAVPEPTTVLAGALMLLPLGVSAVRILRKNRIA